MKWALIYMLIAGNWGAVGTYDSGLRYDTFELCAHEAKEFVKQVPKETSRLKYWRCLPSKD